LVFKAYYIEIDVFEILLCVLLKTNLNVITPNFWF